MANEKRLVNAEAIARKLKYAHCTDCNVVRQIQCSACWVNDVLELLEGDSVDAVEVVRCKDCKHWKLIDSLNPHWECQIFCGLHDYGYLTGADDFCSYGERKDND